VRRAARSILTQVPGAPACPIAGGRGTSRLVWSIVHVLSSYGVGGQERVALGLAQLQRAQGHRVLALSLSDGAHGPLLGRTTIGGSTGFGASEPPVARFGTGALTRVDVTILDHSGYSLI